jgi:formamidopyrimidine-DNA glycosylase
MPELPDLEAYSKNIEKNVSNKAVKEVIIYKLGKLNVSKKEINDVLVSTKVTTCRRDGKEMLLFFDNGQVVSVHLMLEGKFNVTSDIESVNFKMFAFDFGDMFLVISDPRGWAKMELSPEESTTPDALSADFTFEYFDGKIKEKKSKNIKAFLIDQDIVRGIGNAYVDEILWEAKISPASKAGRIPDDVVQRLYEAIRTVLTMSVQEILKINPDVVNGEIRDFMRVHRKDKGKCPNGYSINSKKIASKTTYYTEEQEVF